MALSRSGRATSEGRARTASDRHRVLAVESRQAVLQLLRDGGDELDAGQVAARIGRHVSTTRQHLDVLVDSGVVTRRVEQRTVRGRPRVLYAATSRREPDEGDGLLAMMLATQLARGDDPAGQAEQAGRRWGETLMSRREARAVDVPEPDGCEPDGPASGSDVGAATDGVVALLDEVGFEPSAEPHPDGTVIDLHRCPFLHVAQAHPEVACSLHLGLMRGALESVGAPVVAQRLEPFVTPTLCRAHLSGE